MICEEDVIVNFDCISSRDWSEEYKWSMTQQTTWHIWALEENNWKHDTGWWLVTSRPAQQTTGCFDVNGMIGVGKHNHVMKNGGANQANYRELLVASILIRWQILGAFWCMRHASTTVLHGCHSTSGPGWSDSKSFVRYFETRVGRDTSNRGVHKQEPTCNMNINENTTWCWLLHIITTPNQYRK